MKTFRKPKDCTEHYTSLEELRDQLLKDEEKTKNTLQ